MAAQFGRRLRKGATATTVAALAVAAMTASQAPGAIGSTPGGGQSAGTATTPSDTPATGNSPYFTDLPPLTTPAKPGTSVDTPTTDAESGIPATVLAAYKQAQQTVAGTDPGCHLPWQLLAAIGKVESGQARGGRVDANGTTLSPILGPVLNGVGFANISDTDNGQYDGDRTHDRAVGPMQFIPSTWATWGQDANGDGKKDPNNIYDASLATARYLCAGSRDVAVTAGLDAAILSYNHSQEYLTTVMSWFEYYKKGSHEVPDGTGVLPAGTDSNGAGYGTGGTDNSTGGGGSTPTPSPSATPKPSKSPSAKPTRSPSPSPSKTGKPSPTPTPTVTPTPTPSGDICPTPVPSPSDSASPSPSPSDSASPSPSDSPSPSPSDSASPSPSPSDSPSPSPSDTCAAN